VYALVCALLATTAHAQATLVQTTGLFHTGNGTAITATLPGAPKTGNRLIVLAWSWSGSGTPTISISDSRSHKWTQHAQAAVASSNVGWENAAIFSTTVTTNGASVSVTATSPFSQSQIGAVVLEYSGVGALDQATTRTGTSSTASISTAAATAAANELVVTSFGVLYPWLSNYGAMTPSAGWTARATDIDNLNFTAGGGADRNAATTGVQSITWTGGSAFQGWAAAIAAFRTSATAPDHYSVSPPASAVNCEPAIVTVTAHTSAHVAVTTTNTITLTTSTGHGDWALSSGSGSFTAGASNSGTATYTFASADAGSATFTLRDTYPETVSIGASDGTATEATGSATSNDDPPLTFSPSGFRFTNGSNAATTIGTQRAGVTSTQALALQAIRTDTTTGACTTAFASGTTANISLAYQCNDPTTCIAGQTFTVTNNGTSTAIASNPATGVSSYTSVPLRFSTANAEAPIQISYSDTGRVTLVASYAIPLGSGSASGNVMTGSGQFVVQPYTFVLSNVKRTSDNLANPAASTASGSVFAAAGAPFTATVTARNAQGTATPNFGRETAPATVALTPTLVLPTTGRNPAVTGSFGTFTGGSATGTSFAWSEVGIVTLTPSVSNYLGSGAVAGTTSGNVGRFVPNAFAVAQNTPVIGTTCSSGTFSYVGQPFTYLVPPIATLTAQAVGGATTQNYTGSLMRMTNASLTGRTYSGGTGNPALDTTGLPATTADPAIADLGAGQVSLTYSAGTGLAYTRGTSPVAPFAANVSLAITVADLDGVSASNPVTFGSGTGMLWSTGTTQRWGRATLRSVAGSEVVDLPMPLRVQHWLSAAQGFTTTTDDACTVAPTLAFSNWKRNLQSGETCVRDSGSPGASGLGCPVAAASSKRYRSVASGGDFNLVLAAPGAGNSGAVTVTATVPAWLQYTWGGPGTTATGPAGLATFGVFSGSPQQVYEREVY
jgi:MSHA biogenesis protein MshQ